MGPVKFAAVLSFLLLFLGSVGCSSAPVKKKLHASEHIADEARPGPGVYWQRRVYKDLYGGKQTVNLVFVDLTKRRLLPVLADKCETVEVLFEKSSPIAVVNATFFRMPDCESVNLEKLEGKVTGRNTMRKAGTVTLLMQDNRYWIRHLSRQSSAPHATHALGGFPMLIAEGKVKIFPVEKTGFFRKKHPRTALALLSGSQALLVTVDGRTRHGIGMTVRELADYLMQFRPVSAINFDGGGSTTMIVRDQGTVNYPSDVFGPRAVANGLAVF